MGYAFGEVRPVEQYLQMPGLRLDQDANGYA